MATRLDAAIEATVQALRASRPLRAWLRSLRWCGDSIRPTTHLAVKDRVTLVQSGSEAIVLFLLGAKDAATGARSIHMPLSVSRLRHGASAFELDGPWGPAYLMEAERRPAYARFVLEAVRKGSTVRTGSGDVLRFRGHTPAGFRTTAPLADGETSNLLQRIGTGSGDVVLKSYKLLYASNREPEILARLAHRRLRHAPRFLGGVDLGKGTDRLVLGILMAYVEGVDVFSWLVGGLTRVLRGDDPLEEFGREARILASELGTATAALHEALVDRHPGPWRIGVFTMDDFHELFKASMRQLGWALRRLGGLARSADPQLADIARESRTILLDRRGAIEDVLSALHGHVGGPKGVIHADLHLAQVLRQRPDGGLVFLDFEGEPARSPGGRGGKWPGLRDIGGVVRSFAYVRHFAVRSTAARWSGMPDWGSSPGEVNGAQRTDRDRLIDWEGRMVDACTSAYLRRSTLDPALDEGEAKGLVRAWAMEKALYELGYELRQRVENVPIPVEGIVTLSA